jgi:hypothetical protein
VKVLRQSGAFRSRLITYFYQGKSQASGNVLNTSICIHLSACSAYKRVYGCILSTSCIRPVVPAMPIKDSSTALDAFERSDKAIRSNSRPIAVFSRPSVGRMPMTTFSTAASQH